MTLAAFCGAVHDQDQPDRRITMDVALAFEAAGQERMIRPRGRGPNRCSPGS
jgi:hypothetical protein